jgi:PAS domain S-box-containing protein
MAGIALDITERKRAEAALKESEERLRLFVEGAPAAIAMFDRSMRYLAVSRRFAQDYRLTEQDLIGRGHYELFPEIPERWREIHRRCLAGEILRCDEDPFPRADGLIDWVRWEIRPWRVASGEIGGIILFSEVITERKRAEAALRESEARYRDLFNSIDQGFCIIEVIFDDAGKAVDYRFLEINPVFAKQTGIKNAEGRRMRQIAPDHEEHWFEIYGEVARTGEPVRFQRMAAALGRYYDVYAFRVGRPEQSRVAVLFGDITERKQAEERQRLLMAELDHRVKNTLARMTLICERSRASAGSADELADALSGRLSAMARAHERLSRGKGTGLGLRELVEDELAPYRSQTNESVEGPDLLLTPAAAQALGMVFHELATNAAKYGALSSAGGRLSVRWQVTGENGSEKLDLVWQEAGGPTVAAPKQQGFGTRLIRDLVRHELGGQLELTVAPAGARCELAIPLARLTGAGSRRTSPK